MNMPLLDGNQPHNPNRDKRKNVEINVGKRCNNKCVFCLDGMPTKMYRQFMPFDEMKAELERWYNEGHRSVGFLGGEPTIYPHIVDSVQYANDLGFERIAIASNVTRMWRERFTDRMLDAGLTRVTASMHGHTPDLENRLTRVPGVFEKKCKALRYLIKRRDEDGLLRDGISVNIVLNRWNYKFLPKMMKFFYEDIGLDDLRVNFVRPEGFAVGSKDLTPQYTEVVPVLIKAILLNEHHFNKVFTFGGFPQCVLPKSLRNSDRLLRKYMGEYRDLSTDCSIIADGVPSGTTKIEGARARFNWQDRKKHELKGTLKPCLTCTKRPVCEGVWQNYRDIWGDSEFHSI